MRYLQAINKCGDRHMTKDPQAPAIRRPFFFRCPEDLRQQLERAAEEAERPLAGEIIVRLRASLRRQKPEEVAA
jgi:hypothetical protein